MTHLLQPLDLTNGFSGYFTTCITKALLADLKQDVTTRKVDLTILIGKNQYKNSLKHKVGCF